ncbi:MAG TPA: S16 family serine protease [Sulfolobales archaeon]|nr:S16 family serine protease [Sulfolobales archaeon]
MRLLAIALLLLILSAAQLPLLSTSTSTAECVRIDVPAVEGQSGRGSVVSVAICINPGGNSLRVYGTDKIETDTLISIITAYIIAQLLSNQPPSSYDIDISFEKNVQDVSGPSAGAIMTIAFYSLLSGSEYNGLSGTGAINLDGSIEAVGGIPQKLSALRSSGHEEVFLPIANYIQYRQLIESQFRDLKILPASSIIDLLSVSPPSWSLEAGEEYVIDVISNVSRDHEAVIRDLLERLVNIYISRVSDTGSTEYRLAMGIMDKVRRNPPGTGYASISLYYLSLVQLIQVIVDRDLNGYGKILIQRAVEEYKRSIERLATAFSDIPRSMDLDKFLLYLLIFERAANLASYDGIVKAYTDSGDTGSIARVAGTLYGRALSIDYWLDVLGNMTYSTGVTVDLDDIYGVSRNILRILGISNISEGTVTNLTRIIGPRADLDALKTLNTVYTLYSYLQNYSYTVRGSTLSQIIGRGLGVEASSNAIEQLKKSGYLTNMLGIIHSGVARSIYSFPLWVLNNIDPQSQDTGILVSSLLSTSASALSLNILYMIFSKRVSTPLSLELSGEAKNVFQGPVERRSSADTLTIDLDRLSELLTIASIAISTITLLIHIILSRGIKPGSKPHSP